VEERHILDSVVNTLTSAGSDAIGVEQSPLVARLDALEQRVADLQATLYSLSAPPIQADSAGIYDHKYAIVVGIDTHQEHRLPKLQFAASDAKLMAALLHDYGFDVMLLTDEEATRKGVTDRIGEVAAKATLDDLIVLYYAGNSVKPEDLKMSRGKSLILGTYDFDLLRPEANLTLQDVADQLGAMASRHKLIILDSCYGTSGLELERTNDFQGQATDTVFQVVAGSQDHDVGYERTDLGGGAFTQTLIEVLSSAGDGSGAGIPMNRLVADVGARLARYADIRQEPKLVTVAGSGEIIWKQ
jgi:uncharacterized caspase-like protein